MRDNIEDMSTWTTVESFSCSSGASTEMGVWDGYELHGTIFPEPVNISAGDTFTLTFSGIPDGTYSYITTPKKKKWNHEE